MMILRALFFGLLLGGAVTLFFVQHDAWVKQQVGDTFKEVFEASIGCRMQCAADSLHLFQPAVVLRDVRVTPTSKDEQWYWTAKRLIVSCNWWHLCWYGIIDLHVTLEDSFVYSALDDGVLAINNHVNTLFFGTSSTIPLFTKAVIYKRAHLHLADIKNRVDIKGIWNSESKKIDNHFKSTLSIIDGSVTYNTIPYLKELEGRVYCDIVSDYNSKYVIEADYKAVLAQMAPASQVCHGNMSWADNQGTLSIANQDRSLCIDPVTFTADGNAYTAHIQGTIPISYLAFCAVQKSVPGLHGSCVFKADVTTDGENKVCDGTYTFDSINYQGVHIGTCSGTCSLASDTWSGVLTWSPLDRIHITGVWDWNQERLSAQLALNKEDPLQLVHNWYMQPNSTHCTIIYDPHGVSSSYTSSLVNDYEDKLVKLVGSFSAQQDGYEGSLKYGVDQDRLCSFAVHNKALSGSIHMNFLKWLGAFLNGSEIQGDGNVQWTIADYNQCPLIISWMLDHGTIRIPQTYNAINKAHGIIEWDYVAKKIKLRDMHCSLYKGSCFCNQATLLYDEQWQPFFMHIPLIVNGCLLNVKKDLFALISGHMTYAYAHDHASITGLLTIDHSQLKENIFSDAFAQRFFKNTGMMLPHAHTPTACDVVIKTVVPTQVKTAFLDTAAAIDLHITNTLASPLVGGTISFNSGSLLFPYKPLYITQGKLYFLPGNLYDPLVEFTAKNSIKNNTVSLHVAGSLAKPHVTLESWPSLTQEQIVGLLLVGSYQNSLNMVMPALVMNNITSLIFGDDHSSRAVTSKFASLLEPLKRIRFVPSFTDQTGRGGLRGAIEIDVSDRVHAVIQKNFSLTEDTYFELGYLLSDDINVRLLRDERRDMGAEVEMRWKFGG